MEVDSHALINRINQCEDAGWRTEESSRGYRVYNPAGVMFTVNKIYSDVRSMTVATRRLELAGLKEAEAAMAEIQARNGTTTQERAPKKTNMAAVAKAAGPYFVEAEDPGILFFAEKHPAPLMQWVNITPEIASYLMTQHNTSNRPLLSRRVDRYAAIIRTKQWHMTHQGMAMDSDAVLQDGQHRLAAIIDVAENGDAGLALPVAFFVGMDPRNFLAIDEGLLRTAGQLFALGDEKNGSALQTSIRIILAMREPNPRSKVIRLSMTNEKILDLFDTNRDEFRAAARFGQSNYLKVHASAGPLAAAHYLIRDANGADNAYVKMFFAGLTTGRKAGTAMMLDDDDPRATFRETMLNNRLRGRRIVGLDQLALLLTTWNNLVNDVHPRYLRYTEQMDVPQAAICADTGPDGSVAPRALVGESVE